MIDPDFKRSRARVTLIRDERRREPKSWITARDVIAFLVGSIVVGFLRAALRDLAAWLR